jgi:HEAT repeat protein
MKLNYLIVFIVLLISSCSDSQDHSKEKKINTPVNQVTQKYNKWLKMKESAIDELKEALNDQNWRMRSHAILAMSKIKHPDLIPLIINSLRNDPERAVKNCAVIALGDLKAKASVPDLLKIMDDYLKNGSVNVSIDTIVDSLGKIQDSRAITPLFSVLQKNNKSLRIKVTNALVQMNDPQISTLLIHQHQIVKTCNLQKEASIIFGSLPVAGVEPFLLKWLQQGRISEQIAAAEALGNIQSTKATLLLVEQLKTANETFQRKISKALIKINDSQAVDPLLSYLSDQNQKLSDLIVNTLSTMTVETIPEKVYSIFQKNAEINAYASLILAYKRYLPAKKLILSRLHNISQKGQNGMARSLGLFGDKEFIPLLKEIAKRENSQGAIGAINALGHYKDESVVSFLIALIDTNDKMRTAQIIISLSKIGNKRAVVPLIDIYYQTGDAYSLYIGNTLADIGGDDVIDFVKLNIQSDSISRQRIAGHILTRLKDPKLIPYLNELSTHTNNRIRKYAQTALQSIENNKK